MTQKRQYIYPDASELTVVIRAAGERTEPHCIDSFARQLPDRAQLIVLRESPFSAAVQHSLKIGVESARPWLIAVDADIMPLDDVVVRIREICAKMDARAFVATPLFLCRAVGGLATRGLHCYRASLLPEALDILGSLPQDLRPESRIHDAMVARGYTRECYAKILGLHEYEQFAKHIYLKAMLRSRKDEFSSQIRSNLTTHAESNPDCQIALWGFEDTGTKIDQPIEYDWNARYPLFEHRMSRRGWTEKTPLELNDLDGFSLRTINAHDYLGDAQTLPWIREILRFEQGAPEALAYVNTTPKLTEQPQSAIG